MFSVMNPVITFPTLIPLLESHFSLLFNSAHLTSDLSVVHPFLPTERTVSPLTSKTLSWSGTVAHTCNPSTLGGQGWRIT